MEGYVLCVYVERIHDLLRLYQPALLGIRPKQEGSGGGGREYIFEGVKGPAG